MPPNLAEVRSLRDGSALTDIPAMLRELADLIEAGGPSYEGLTQIAVIRDGGEGHAPAIHAYGQCSAERTLVLVARAQAELLRMLNDGPITREIR